MWRLRPKKPKHWQKFSKNLKKNASFSSEQQWGGGGQQRGGGNSEGEGGGGGGEREVNSRGVFNL